MSYGRMNQIYDNNPELIKLKNEYVGYLAQVILSSVDNIAGSLFIDNNMSSGHWYSLTSWTYRYDDIPQKILNKIKNAKSVSKPDLVHVYKIYNAETKVKVKVILTITIKSVSKDRVHFNSDVNTSLIIAVKQGNNKICNNVLCKNFCGYIDGDFMGYIYEVFGELLNKLEAVGYK